MSQSKKGSFIEACINVFIGFWINYIANLLIFPLFGMSISLSDNLLLGAIYTFISVARTYAIRRWFNLQIEKAANKLASKL
jgi:hypothetical protein